MQLGACSHILQGGPDIRLACRQHGCLSSFHALVAQDAPRPGKSNALCNRKMARRSTLPNVREGSIATVLVPRRLSGILQGTGPTGSSWAASDPTDADT